MERNERRSYFRIDDVIGLSYQVIDAKPQLVVPKEDNAGAALKLALAEIDAELNRATNTVWRENPAMAKALGILNKKVALIAKHCPTQDIEPLDAYEEYTANISGSGMSFRSTEKLEKGTHLNISAVLKPSNIRLHFSAHVVDCKQVQDMPRELFLLRVQIAEEETAAKEQLVQHVVQKQSQNRVEEKQTSHS
ncbi:MAG: PilZ domain-containing protein [Halioglobus sp.]